MLPPGVFRNDLDIVCLIVPGVRILENLVLPPQVVSEVMTDSGLVGAEMTREVLACLVVPQDVSLHIVRPGGLVVAVVAGDGMEHQLVVSPHHLHVQRELLGRLLVADIENILNLKIFL